MPTVLKAAIALLLLTTACGSPSTVVIPTLVTLPMQVAACPDWPAYDAALVPIVGQVGDLVTVMMRTIGQDMPSGIPELERLRTRLASVPVTNCYLMTHERLLTGLDWAITGFRLLSEGSPAGIGAFDAANAYWELAMQSSDLPRTSALLRYGMDAWGGTIPADAAITALGLDSGAGDTAQRIQATAAALEQAVTQIWETYLTPAPTSGS